MEKCRLALIVLIVWVCAACSREEAGTLQAAMTALDVDEVRSIEYSGTGRWFQFGQAPSPRCPGRRSTSAASRRASTTRRPPRRCRWSACRWSSRTAPGRLRCRNAPVQFVSGSHAWNVAIRAGAAPDAPPAPQPQPAAVEERTMEIWTTPHGFLKAAAANNATSQPAEGGSEVSFTVGGKHRYVGRINAQNQVERVQTWIDNPILGDTPVEVAYSDYRDFDGVMFPGEDRPDAGRTSGARADGLIGHAQSAGRHPGARAGAQLHASAGERRGREARRRRLLHQGRQPPQRRHRSARPHRRRRGAAGRSTFACGHRQGQGDDSEASRSATSSTRTCTSITPADCARTSPRARRSSRTR